MPVHHLRMLDRHRSNYNKQDTVLAQLLYHLNTAHINASCPVLVQRWSTISRCWPSVAPTIVRKTRYATCTLTCLQQLLTALSCDRTTALVQCRANAISSHYDQDVGPTLGQCLQLVSFIYKYAIFPVDLSD